MFFLAGFNVRKGTLIFLNNFQLNYCPKLWQNPEEFNPDRFLHNGRLTKPEHFFPFSTGRRSCMGYKMVHLISFLLTTLTLQKYEIQPASGFSYDLTVGSLALPYETFKFNFVSSTIESE